MPRYYRDVPLGLRSSKRGERRIIRLLSSLPRTEPEVEIRPLEEVDFRVDLREYSNCYAPLEVGEEGFYADYDARRCNFMEATSLKVARRVKVLGVWCLEVYETGGADMDGRFELCWDGPHYYRAGPGYACTLDPACGEMTCHRDSRRFAPSREVKLIDENSMEGPRDGSQHFAGYAAVKVGGIEHQCMRLLSTWQFGDKPESLRLDDAYVSEAGRTVLVRRCKSLEDYMEWMDYLKSLSDKQWEREWEEDWTAGRARITYNGQGFYHWFDILTDYTLGPIMTPEWKPPAKRKRGR